MTESPDCYVSSPIYEVYYRKRSGKYASGNEIFRKEMPRKTEVSSRRMSFFSENFIKGAHVTTECLL